MAQTVLPTRPAQFLKVYTGYFEIWLLPVVSECLIPASHGPRGRADQFGAYECGDSASHS